MPEYAVLAPEKRLGRPDGYIKYLFSPNLLRLEMSGSISATAEGTVPGIGSTSRIT